MSPVMHRLPRNAEARGEFRCGFYETVGEAFSHCDAGAFCKRRIICSMFGAVIWLAVSRTTDQPDSQAWRYFSQSPIKPAARL